MAIALGTDEAYLLLEEMNHQRLNMFEVYVKLDRAGRDVSAEVTTNTTGMKREDLLAQQLFLTKKLSESMVSYNAVNDRIMMVGIDSKLGNLHIIKVYASTSSSSLGDIEQFYNYIQKRIRYPGES